MITSATILRLLPLLLLTGCVHFETRPLAPAETAARLEQCAADRFRAGRLDTNCVRAGEFHSRYGSPAAGRYDPAHMTNL